jgi:hypothetical protein
MYTVFSTSTRALVQWRKPSLLKLRDVLSNQVFLERTWMVVDFI